MLSFLLFVAIAAFVGVAIWVLRKDQRRQTVDTVDRTAPLAPLGSDQVPDFRAMPARPTSAPATTPTPTAVTSAPSPDVTDTAPEPAPAASTAASDKWIDQVKALREARQFDAALAQCVVQFPRTQAFQQTAIILRQQIREASEQDAPVDTLFESLYQTAVLADLFRTGNPHKPDDPQQALELLRHSGFSYAAIGHRELKLLNKSDVRAIEQMWGKPQAHRHVEDALSRGSKGSE